MVLRDLVRAAALSLVGIFLFVVDDASAQRMGKKACQNAQWLVLGADDALSGRAEHTFLQRLESCAKKSIHANAADWQAGYDTMLPVLCAEEFSYGLGKRGRRLEASCPAEIIREAVNANSIGYEFYKFRSAYLNAIEDHNDDVSSIKSARTSIKISQKKLAKTDISPEKSRKHQDQISRAVKEIDELRSGLDYKKQVAESAEREFFAFKPTATEFEWELAAKGRPNGAGEMAFDPPEIVSGNIKEGTKRGIFFTIERSAIPVLFEEAYVRIADFEPPEKTRDGDLKCALDGKLKRKAKKARKNLKKQNANVRVHGMTIKPPSYESDHSVRLVGDVILEANGDLATYFIDEGLAVRESELPLSAWFKNKSCFARDAAPESDAAEILTEQ